MTVWVIVGVVGWLAILVGALCLLSIVRQQVGEYQSDSSVHAATNDDELMIYSRAWSRGENEERARRLYSEGKISLDQLERWLDVIENRPSLDVDDSDTPS